MTLNLRLEDTGQADAMPLEDHPRGDRAFAAIAPYGVGLYTCADTEPSEGFRQYFT